MCVCTWWGASSHWVQEFVHTPPAYCVRYLAHWIIKPVSCHPRMGPRFDSFQLYLHQVQESNSWSLIEPREHVIHHEIGYFIRLTLISAHIYTYTWHKYNEFEDLHATHIHEKRDQNISTHVHALTEKELIILGSYHTHTHTLLHAPGADSATLLDRFW